MKSNMKSNKIKYLMEVFKFLIIVAFVVYIARVVLDIFGVGLVAFLACIPFIFMVYSSWLGLDVLLIAFNGDYKNEYHHSPSESARSAARSAAESAREEVTNHDSSLK